MADDQDVSSGAIPEFPEDRLRCIGGLPDGDQREKAIDEFLAANAELISFVARRQCRAWGLRSSQHFEDIFAITQETAWEILAGIDAEKANEIRSWPAHLMIKTRSAVRVATESSAWTGVSGAVGLVRRHRALKSRLDKIQQDLGPDLSNEQTREAVTSYNDELLATRADVGKQGALVSEADLTPPSLVPLTDADEPSFTVDESDVSHFEMLAIIRAVIASAYREQSDLGEIARRYYGPYLADGDEPASVAEIARRTGYNRMKVSRAVWRILEISRTELAAFGILEP